MSAIDNARKTFSDGLKRKVADKRVRALAASKKQAKRAERIPKVAANDVVLAELSEIRELLEKYNAGTAGPVTFTVTERDLSGKIKSFKVDRS